MHCKMSMAESSLTVSIRSSASALAFLCKSVLPIFMSVIPHPWTATSKYATPAGLRLEGFACSRRTRVSMCNLRLVSHCFPLMDLSMIPCCDTSMTRNGHEPDDARAGQPSRTLPYEDEKADGVHSAQPEWSYTEGTQHSSILNCLHGKKGEGLHQT